MRVYSRREKRAWAQAGGFGCAERAARRRKENNFAVVRKTGEIVMPAEAGIQEKRNWIPAFAGMTRLNAWILFH